MPEPIYTRDEPPPTGKILGVAEDMEDTQLLTLPNGEDGVAGSIGTQEEVEERR